MIPKIFIRLAATISPLGILEILKEDQQGNLWIATDKGLNKLNPDRTSFTSYFHNPMMLTV